MKRIKGRGGLVSNAESAVSPGGGGGKWKKASQHRRGRNEKEVWDEKKMKTGESWIWRYIHSFFARVCATASQGEVSQSAGGGRGSDFLLKEQSNKLSLFGCYNAVVAMVATADPTKKPTRVYILCPRLLLTMGLEWGEKKASQTFICSREVRS